MTRRRLFSGLTLAALLTVPRLLAEGPRPLRVDDIFALKTVGDPQISPDGAWVAYTVRSLDPKEDASDTDVYMVPLRRRRARAAHRQPEAGDARRASARTAAISPSSPAARARRPRSGCSTAAAARRSS